ncbi:MAG: CpaE family protein [Sphingopyxis sp.]
MNAPFRLGQQSTRESFAAYLCDDDTIDMIRPVVNDMGWPIEKLHKGGLRNAVQSLSITSSPSILLVDLSESSDPINDINGLAEVCEPGTVVIAMGQVNDVRLFRDLVASGIHDYLLKPVFPEQVRDVLMHAQAMLNAPRQSEPVDKMRHTVTAVIGTRGGVGASSVATSLAWMMGATGKRSSALLDLDVHFGTGALALDLEPGRGLIDAIDNPARIDGLFIERAMVRANDKLAILSAEAPINQPLLSDGGTFFHLREEITAAFEATVIDLPRNMMITYPHMLADVQSVVLVTELTLASARDAIRLLAAFKSTCPAARVIIVANKVAPTGSEISRKDFETSIERTIDIVVPFDAKVAIKSAKLGKCLAETARGSKLAPSLNRIAQLVISSADEEDEDEGNSARANAPAEGKSSSLLGKLGDIGSLLPKKKPKE